MFQTHVSQSHFTSLDEVVARLTRHREVESIAILGSRAKGILNPASDYDILVVLSEAPVPVSLVLTTIAQRLAEVVFFSLNGKLALRHAHFEVTPQTFLAHLK